MLRNHYLLQVQSLRTRTQCKYFFIQHINNTKFHRLRCSVKLWTHWVILHIVQNNHCFPLHQSWLQLLCSFYFIIIWPALSNLTSGITLMWPADNDKTTSRLLSASAKFVTGHVCSTLEVQKVQYICSLYLPVYEPCSYYSPNYHTFKWSSAQLYNKQTKV